MADRRRSFLHPSTWGVGYLSIVAIGVYLAGLITHIAINRLCNRAMANEGLAFWQAFGTVIAAVIASVYGSSYAFALNRQKDIEAVRRSNLEAGRWVLVVLASHLTFITRTAKQVYSEQYSPHWPLLMRNILSFENPPELTLDSIQFLLHTGSKKATNYLISAATDCSVSHVKSYIQLRNGLRDRLKVKLDEYLDSHPEVVSDPAKDNIQEEYSRLAEKLEEAIGIGRAHELRWLGEQLHGSCELGIKSVYDLYNELRELLSEEFQEEEFKPIDLEVMWKELGRKLW